MLILLLILGLILVALVLAIALGGPARPSPMASINDPFGLVDVSDLPPLVSFRAADGQPLAYRVYASLGERQGSVTLVHGSSASSNSMHPLAEALAATGYHFNLAMNFRPQPDYLATIRAVTKPCAILAGTHDEAFYSDRLEEMFQSAGQQWPVELVPNVGHIQLILEPVALAAIVRCVRQLQQAA